MESPGYWGSKTVKRWVFWLILVPLFAWIGRDGGVFQTFAVFGENRRSPVRRRFRIPERGETQQNSNIA